MEERIKISKEQIVMSFVATCIETTCLILYTQDKMNIFTIIFYSRYSISYMNLSYQYISLRYITKHYPIHIDETIRMV